MTVRTLAATAAFALALIGAVQADEIRPAHGASIDLGRLSGVAYYTVDGDRFRVVATLAQDATAAPVRFEASLVSGQSVVLSSPGQTGGAPVAVEISRRNDQVFVQRAAVSN
jgi:hypothetical protein